MTIVIAIDTGVNTGIAVWDAADYRLLRVECVKIHVAMRIVDDIFRNDHIDDRVMVLFEDARLRKWFGGADAREKRSGSGVREGIGSVKRDASIWEDFLTDLGVTFIPRKPVVGGTKWSAKQFKQLTKWEGQTNEHSRDAAMMVFGFSETQVQCMLRAFGKARKEEAPPSNNILQYPTR